MTSVSARPVLLRGTYLPDKSWISQGGAHVNLEDGYSSDWDSERNLTVLEPMEGLSLTARSTARRTIGPKSGIGMRRGCRFSQSLTRRKITPATTHAADVVQMASGKGDGH